MVRESAIEFERTSHARAALSGEKRCGDCRKCVSRIHGGGVNGAATSYSVRYVVLRVDLGGAAVCSFSSRSQQFHASRCTTRFRMRASKASLSTETVAHAAEKSAEMPQSASSPDLSLQMLLRGGCDYGRGWTR